MLYILLFSLCVFNQTQESFDNFRTCFQTSGGYDPKVDIASDVAIVYGTSPNLSERINSWKEQDYRTAYMTGISWGNYESYYLTENGLKEDEIQTEKSGKLWMHGNSKTVGYNVPTPSYVEFIKSILIPPLENRVEAIYLEEPEFWAVTGWSKAFKELWEKHYGEPWSPPDESIETQYKASLLKYHLYTNTLKDVFQFVKEYAQRNNFRIGCYVPTHSLINYAQWRIVSPESMLTKMENCDGIIAQVWTGTARSRHHYKGIPKERTFETAYLEYAQMVGMVLPTKKHLIFLADPIEDNPNHDWNDYRYNYESTVLASLLFPEVYTYEVMPWPQRIFTGKYSRSQEVKDEKIKIPPEYGLELLTVINALNDMKQSNVQWISGDYPIGILVSDTLMFQRAEPTPSDAHLNCFYGMATPLVKHGVPVKIIQMEHLLEHSSLKNIKILLLSYEGQKPLKKEYHEAIYKWVREGGNLLIFDDLSDPYNELNLWWKKEGFRSPAEHLLKTFFNDKNPDENILSYGYGHIRWIKENPTSLSRDVNGATRVLDWVKEMASMANVNIEYKNYFHLKRGPYHICAVMDESISDQPYVLRGKFINLFNPELKVEEEIVITPSNRAFVIDLNSLDLKTNDLSIVTSAGRIKTQKIEGKYLSFSIRGPEEIPGKVIVYSSHPPEKISSSENIDFRFRYEIQNNLIYIDFIHKGKDIHFEIEI